LPRVHHTGLITKNGSGVDGLGNRWLRFEAEDHPDFPHALKPSDNNREWWSFIGKSWSSPILTINLSSLCVNKLRWHQELLAIPIGYHLGILAYRMGYRRHEQNGTWRKD
jgi:hypothetical protein